MNILGHVAVYPTPDARITRLTELAYNLWWSWNPQAQTLYEELDPELWRQVNHNPVKFLRQVSQRRLDLAAGDPAYVTRYAAVMAQFDTYMHPDRTWWEAAYPELRDQCVAYFSAEFGLHEALPIYSGGLGVLAGDHCKEASDLGLPFVGVGFLYPQGYFTQRIDADGRQQAIYEKLDFSEAPATPACGADGKEIFVSVDLPGRTVFAKVWRIQVGRVPVFLMDTDVEQNAQEDRELAARLYGGNQEIRISQEVVLGIGGVRTLRALGYEPTVWHMNEGHAAFLQLERVREYIVGGLDLQAALWAARSDALFTTHTPVPAGNDSFPFPLIDRFFGDYWDDLHLDRDQFLALGRFDYSWGAQFSMTVLALRTAGRANGVSDLHGAVSRRLWQGLYPGLPVAEVPIGHVTNGIHTDSWLHPELASLYGRYLGPNWRARIDDPATWTAIAQIPDAELWGQHLRAKSEMIALARERLVGQCVRVKAPMADLKANREAFERDVLTIGFARRFATYKRAALIFKDQERLKRILNDPDRPLQIIFAGKAHPADEPGKALIQFIYEMSRQPGFAGKILFVEGYDINLARHMVAGCDLWLNTPRRPLEASGTSGQKAGLNGAVNFSVLDGWWAEGYAGGNGWAIGEAHEYLDEATQDEVDANSFYRQLEEEIVPLYYDRDQNGIPVGWLARMRTSIATVAPKFSLARMLKDYVNHYYVPASAACASLREDRYAYARQLAEWETRVRAGWSTVQVSARMEGAAELRVREPLQVEATVNLGRLAADDLAVELVYGPSGDGDLSEVFVVPMHATGSNDGQCRYEARFASSESGNFAYGVRVRPANPALPDGIGLPLVCWAS